MPEDPSDVHAAARLRDMIMGFRVTQMLHVAAKLNLADHLAEAPRSAEQLASIARADPGALRRLMRALTSIGIFTETDGVFALTAVGQRLRRDAARKQSCSISTCSWSLAAGNVPQAEYCQLLEVSGFALLRVLDTKSPISIIEAQPATR